MKKNLLLLFQLICICSLHAQNETNYNPFDFFAPTFNPLPANEFRSAKGIPGPAYWQNNVDYLIHATLNEKDTSIAGDVTINYINNSPDKLDYLWLQLDQNLFSSTSRGTLTTPPSGYRFESKGNNGGFQIESVTVTDNVKTYTINPIITDTRMQLRLRNPVLAKGGKVTVTMHFSFFIPEYGSDRMGRMNASKGMIYEIAQWYPRMCVYDDVEGWNVLPYMGASEFYCEYGNFDYYITVPSNMTVYASGDLQNPAEVLSGEEIKRLTLAAESDKPVYIIKAGEIGNPSIRPALKENLTWHFTMKNTRDVAWAASAVLIWDAAKINLPSGRKAMAMSAYMPEVMGDSAWSRSTEYLKSSVEIYSNNYFEYPWSTAYSIAGPVSGMEYPGMTFNDYKEKNANLWFLISHEIGHSWYPMIVGSNERRYGWQDEGVNTFINLDANEIFNNGEYAYDPLFSDKDFWANLDVSSLPHRHYPLMVLPEAMSQDEAEREQYYSKTAYGLKLLRYQVVGRERFDYAFRKYTEAWAFKHPTPYDFFRCINNAAGEDLNWFWKEWFFTNWTLDQAITDVKYVDDDPAKGALITIENKGKIILPVIMKIQQSNGDTAIINLPVEIWQRGGTWVYKYASTQKIDKVVLDPEKVLPDVDRKNNEWSK